MRLIFCAALRRGFLSVVQRDNDFWGVTMVSERPAWFWSVLQRDNGFQCDNDFQGVPQRDNDF